MWAKGVDYLSGVQLIVLPPVEDLQSDEATRAKWVDYSAYDAKATWQLAQALRKELQVASYQPPTM